MAVNVSRSRSASLAVGVTDGKYVSQRPNTETDKQNVTGDRLTRANRDALSPLNGYGGAESPSKISPSSW